MNEEQLELQGELIGKKMQECRKKEDEINENIKALQKDLKDSKEMRSSLIKQYMKIKMDVIGIQLEEMED